MSDQPPRNIPPPPPAPPQGVPPRPPDAPPSGAYVPPPAPPPPPPPPAPSPASGPAGAWTGPSGPPGPGPVAYPPPAAPGTGAAVGKARRRRVRLIILGVVGALIAAGIVSSILNPTVSTDSLKTGMCVRVPDLSGGKTKEVNSLPKRSCTKAHNGEVFAVVNHTATSYPGSGSDEVAQQLCRSAFASYVKSGDDASGYALSLITPTKSAWDKGQRRVVCIIRYLDGDRTASVRA